MYTIISSLNYTIQTLAKKLHKGISIGNESILKPLEHRYNINVDQRGKTSKAAALDVSQPQQSGHNHRVLNANINKLTQASTTDVLN